MIEPGGYCRRWSNRLAPRAHPYIDRQQRGGGQEGAKGGGRLTEHLAMGRCSFFFKLFDARGFGRPRSPIDRLTGVSIKATEFDPKGSPRYL